MKHYPSTNFSTVFFLVVLFIGMGVLSYHVYEITVENRQLHEDVITLQADMTTLSIENTSLKGDISTLHATIATIEAENQTLKAENSTIDAENNMLKVALLNEVSQNKFLDAPDADKLAELENLNREIRDLKMENLRLAALPKSGTGEESAFVPWINMAVVILFTVHLRTFYRIYALVKVGWQKKIASLLGTHHSSKKNQIPHIVESRFVDR